LRFYSGRPLAQKSVWGVTEGTAVRTDRPEQRELDNADNKEDPMKIILRLLLIIALLVVGFAAGFPVGENIGFSAGSEWSMMQAELFAKERGLYMPVTYDGTAFRVVMKQPGLLYQRAWKLADLHDDELSR
jgi:hypothetical protein